MKSGEKTAWFTVVGALLALQSTDEFSSMLENSTGVLNDATWCSLGDYCYCPIGTSGSFTVYGSTVITMA